jgi:hypothetical protein
MDGLRGVRDDESVLQQSLKMPSKKFTMATLLATALVYFLLDALNRALFSSTALAGGESWIYLPAGLQLAFILIFLDTGAAGITLASCAIGWVHFSGMDPVTVLGAGLISGFSPWLARIICLEKFKLDQQLHQLNQAALVKMALTFAALHAVMLQLWLSWSDPAIAFIDAAAKLFVADLLGTLILLYIAKYAIGLMPAPGQIK